jgi:hypothetical protein
MNRGITFARRCPSPTSRFDCVVDLGHFQMQGSFDGLDLLVLAAVAIALENSVSAPLVVIAPQELGHFEFDGFLKHELGAQPDAFRQWRLPCGGAEKLFFKGLAEKLAFHVCLLLSVLPAQLESAPSWFLQEAQDIGVNARGLHG